MQIIDTIVQFSKLHPDYAIALTFLMAFAESLIVIGGFIPGSLAITAIREVFWLANILRIT